MIIQEINRLISTKKGRGKFLLFSGNVERVITIYAPSSYLHHCPEELTCSSVQCGSRYY